MFLEATLALEGTECSEAIEKKQVSLQKERESEKVNS